MASSRTRRRPVFAPVVEDLSHRILNYAIRNYVFKDSGSVFRGDYRASASASGKDKDKDKDKDRSTTSHSMPGLSRSRSKGYNNDAGFESIERFGRAVYNTISGRRQRQAREEREREERRAREKELREEEHERRRRRRRLGREGREGDIERIERVVGDLHGVSGTLRDMARRPPGHACDFYNGFARREPRMQRALGGAVGQLRDVIVVEHRRGRDGDRGGRRDRARSWGDSSRGGAGSAHGTAKGSQSARSRVCESMAAAPPNRRRRRRADAGLNEDYYGPGNPTYEHDAGWRKGGGKRGEWGKGLKPAATDRQGSWERRRPGTQGDEDEAAGR